MFVGGIAIIDLGLILEYHAIFVLPLWWCGNNQIWAMKFPSILENEVFPNIGIIFVPPNPANSVYFVTDLLNFIFGESLFVAQGGSFNESVRGGLEEEGV